MASILYAHALHVLTADVQNKINPRQELLGSLIVSHGFDYAVIGVKTCLYETFPVASHRGISDICTLREQRIYFLEHLSGGGQRVALVAFVEAVEQPFIFVYDSSLCGGRPGIYAEKERAFSLADVSARDLCIIVPLPEQPCILLHP